MLRQFLKDSFIYSLVNILTTGFGVIMMPIYTKNLSPSEYGVIDLITVFQSFAGILIGLEITQATAKFYGDLKNNEDELKTFISSCINFSLIGATIFFLFCLFFSSSISEWLFNTNAYKNIIIISAATFLLNRFFQIIIVVMKGMGKTKNVAIISLIGSLATLSLSIYYIVNLKTGVVGYFYSGLISSLILFIIVAFQFKKFIQFKLDISVIKKALSFSAPLVFSGLSLVILNYTDRILINKFMNIENVGIYGVAYRISSIMNIVLMGFTTALAPIVYSNYKDINTPKKIIEVFKVFLASILILATFVILFAKKIIITFTSESYNQSVGILPLLILMNIFAAVCYFFPGLYLKSKTKLIAVISLAGGLVNLILNFIFIPICGLAGSAYASALSYFLILFFSIYFSQKKYPIPYVFKEYLIPIFLFILVLLIANLDIISEHLNNFHRAIIFILFCLFFILNKFIDINKIKNELTKYLN